MSKHFQALASILFCYVNQQLVFPACKNLTDPSSTRLEKLFFRVNFGVLVIYLIIGLSGYLLLLEHSDVEPIGPIIITSIPIWQINLGKALMVLALYLAIPLNLFPSRAVLF